MYILSNDISASSPGPKSPQQKRRSVSFPCDPAVRQRIRARMVARRVSEWREQQLEETEKVCFLFHKTQSGYVLALLSCYITMQYALCTR